MTDTEKVEKIVALLLNRTEAHKWMYFDIVFDEVSPARPGLMGQNSLIEDLLDNVKVVLPQAIDLGSAQSGSETSPIDSDTMLALVEYIRNNNVILQDVMSRIFDINLILADSNVVESARTNAFTGFLRTVNESETEKRKKRFYAKFQNNPDFRNNPNNVVVLAEGDSWFQFPKLFWKSRLLGKDFVKDIIDQLSDDSKSPNYNVYSLAAGGDWLENMLNETTQDYIENLTKISPDVFLVSGGGNDLVDDKRLAHMVRDLPRDGARRFDPNDETWMNQKLIKLLKKRREDYQDQPIFDAEKYERGLSLVSDDYFRFLNICLVQYFTLFYRLLKTTSKFKNMMIVTHGYDFGVPTMKKHGGLLHRIVNWKMNSGKWLFTPLVMRGISDPEDQKAVIYFMIFEFNEMLIKLAKYDKFYNVFHIDCRGSVAEDEWFDELHPVSGAFERISETYKKCISDNLQHIRDLSTDEDHNQAVSKRLGDKLYIVR
jgi:hypothetical protein